MSTVINDTVDDMFDNKIDINTPVDWEFLGASGPRSWDRWSTYGAGDCIRLPNGEVWCARRTVNPGDAGPGESGWSHAWGRVASKSVVGAGGISVGHDYARYAMEQQRSYGRGGGVSAIGHDYARYATEQQRSYGRDGGVSAIGRDFSRYSNEEQQSAEHVGHDYARYTNEGQQYATPVGALVADYHTLHEDGVLGVRDYHTLHAEGLFGDDPVIAAALVTQEIVRRVRDDKIPASPPTCVTVFGEDIDTGVMLMPVSEEILGNEEIDDANFPLTASLYRHYRERVEPKFVRLDTEESYRDFRAGQSPEIAALIDRVTRLERAVAAHGQDGHGAEGAILGLASDVAKLRAAADGKRVPLQMPPWMEGTWDCWYEEGPSGGIVCCSISVPGHDGCVRVCTAAKPVKGHVDQVVGHALDIGCDVNTLLGVLPTVACMVAGSYLLSEMAAAIPSVLAHPAAEGDSPLIGKIVPANKPTMAALMLLLQKAQAGDAQATKEWQTLAQIAGANSDLCTSMTEAKRRVVEAQARASR